MNKKIKSFAVLAGVCILLIGLLGCSSGNEGTNEPSNESANSGDASAKKELIFWTLYKESSANFEFFKTMGERYTNEVDPSVEIVVESIPSSEYLGTKLITAFAAGDGPDIFFVAPSTMLRYYNAGILKDLTDYIDREAKADFAPTAFDVTTLDGKIYGIPYEQDLVGLAYDIDLFKENNMTPPTTWDEMKEDALKLATNTRAGLTFHITPDDHGVFIFSPFIWGTGGDILSADRKTATLNSPGVKQALSYWRDLMVSGALNKKPSRVSSDIGIIADGETAMQVMGSWGIAPLETTYPDRNIGIVPLPIPEGGTPVTVAGGWKIVANKDSDYADDAAKYISWLFANPDPTSHVVWDTEVKFGLPVRNSVQEIAKDVYSKGLRKNYTEQILGTEKAEMRIPPEVSKIMQDMIQEALYKTDTSIDDIAEKYNQKFEEFLKKYEGVM
ncbi:MAG: sugar ABC transporter substrate-binding protein [Paenibacillaceae bacterium]